MDRKEIVKELNEFVKGIDSNFSVDWDKAIIEKVEE